MPAIAPTLLTTKRLAHLEALTLECGVRLRDVAIGYETYGRLAPSADNAVLVCHFVSGTSHAAGRYAPDDAVPGWWDAVIGPGKAIDTDRWFVVAIDALGCVRRDQPHGVTTSAASPNPATGRPYGPDFPALAIADMVEAQRQVLAQLGIERLAAVAGPSLGAMQAIEWALRHPGSVDRLIAALLPADFQAPEVAWYRAMEDAIRLDPAFAEGRYGDAQPLDGLATSLKLMMLLAGGREALNETFGAPLAPEAVETWLARESRARAGLCDANSWITMLRANTRWRPALRDPATHAGLRARTLLLPARGDALLPHPSYHVPIEAAMRAAGVDLHVAPLAPRHGHMAGLVDIGEGADAIRALLEREG